MKAPRVIKHVEESLHDVQQPIPEHMIQESRLRGNPSRVYGRYERHKTVQWSVYWTTGAIWLLWLFNTYPLDWMRQTDPESKSHAFWVLFGPICIVAYQWLKDNTDKLAHR
jgi:hypothetical protein